MINNHLYSIRIEMYERTNIDEPLLITVWQYPLYFDYLPVFRFAKLLQLIKLNKKEIPCSSNPCNRNEDCQSLMNDKSKYICLYKENFSLKDEQCINGYCSSGSICKSNYRGISIGNELPYCICPFDQFGERFDIKYDQCLITPRLNNGRCYSELRRDSISCICTEEYYGKKKCEFRKPEIKLYINESISYSTAVVQYFDIDFVSLNVYQ